MALDQCLEIRATANAPLLLSKHRKFIGCNCDSDCVLVVRPALLRVFAEQVLSIELDILESGEVQAAAENYLILSCAESETEWRSLWNGQKKFLLSSRFQPSKLFS